VEETHRFRLMTLELRSFEGLSTPLYSQLTYPDIQKKGGPGEARPLDKSEYHDGMHDIALQQRE